MKILSSLALGLTLLTSRILATEKTYNILSIDGGGIRGIFPAGVLLEIEKFAYKYAKGKGYNVPTYTDENGKLRKSMHLKDIFDMTAGTSTGSIISAALAYPEKDGKKPKYFMNDILEIYITYADRMFVSNKFSGLTTFLWVFLFVAIFAASGYYHGMKRWDNPEKEAGLKAQLAEIEQFEKQEVEERNKLHHTNTIVKFKEQSPRKDINGDDDGDDDSFHRMQDARARGFNNINEQILQKLIQNNIQTKIKSELTSQIQYVHQTGQMYEYQKKIIINQNEFEQNKARKWFVMTVWIVIGFFIGAFVPGFINKLSHAKYDRASLENVFQELLGEFKISQTITDELLITAYDYNSQEPRFYSKYFAKQSPNIYDVPVGNATGASSAAPTFFNPKNQINAFGLQELQIDGGVICNNPALYAYQIATLLNEKKKVRILSLGTGENPFTHVDSKYDFDKFSYLLYKNEFMMNMDTYSADYYLQQQFAAEKRPQDYLRLQKVTTISMDDIKQDNLDLLAQLAKDVYNDPENQVKIQTMISTIIDEKYKK